MLKSWLRELPDELFPKAAQDRINQQYGGGAAPPETVPQLLIDELSALSPFNYYLLFAITCHLSLLLAHSDKNKMNFQNLCICFQPCMKIDMFCFKFLVCDWRDCWKGCQTEALYTEAEYECFAEENGEVQGKPPNSAEGRSSTAIEESHDERNVSSSDSSKPSSVSVNDHQGRGQRQDGHGGKSGYLQNQQGQQSQHQHQQERNGKTPLSLSGGSLSTVSTTSAVKDRKAPGRSAGIRPLSPIKPLSPIGL